MIRWKSWALMLIVTASLAAVLSPVNRGVQYLQWWADGHLAVAEACDELERLGVDPQITSDTAPSGSRYAVAGHVKTGAGTQPFFVEFRSSNGKRIPARVTVGSEVLLGQDYYESIPPLNFDAITGESSPQIHD